jgi:RNA polymerase sigma-54 factor
MAFGPRLELRQSQSLVMTPQLLQAIKLLQLSSLELSDYVEEELERNPLLERASNPDDEPVTPPEIMEGAALRGEGDWASDELGTDRGRIENDIGTDLSNAFPDESPPLTATASANLDGPSLPGAGALGATGKGGSFDGDDGAWEDSARADISLQDHLERQAMPKLMTPGDKGLAGAIISSIDDTGYLCEPLEAIAARLGADIEDAEAVLGVVQSCEPPGVGARSLAECLALQLTERKRFDPAMQALVANLPLLAKRDFPGLRRLCKVDEEDLADMVSELRALDPKPGLAFTSVSVQSVIPDVFVRYAPDGGWAVELNSDALPRVIANKAYYTRLGRMKDTADKSFIDEAWTSANWLTRSLDQRAKTILKVATEIVRQQDEFFLHGVQHLRPLNLKMIADAVSLHESTISRVTSNKYVATPRGTFEMKYFFTASISATEGQDAHSAEAVRFRIRQLIEAEQPSLVLSDDALVDALRAQGIEIARRTVAKYREAMRIPSSALRRREKKGLQAGAKMLGGKMSGGKMSGVTG